MDVNLRIPFLQMSERYQQSEGVFLESFRWSMAESGCKPIPHGPTTPCPICARTRHLPECPLHTSEQEGDPVGNVSFCEESTAPYPIILQLQLWTNPQKEFVKSLTSADPVGWWGGASHNQHRKQGPGPHVTRRRQMETGPRPCPENP